MYEDDHYHPNNIENDNLNKFSNIKKMNKHFHYKYIKYLDSKGKTKKRRIEFYNTAETMGNQIRNAIDGQIYPNMLTGTKCEDLFFKIRIFVKDDNEEKEKGYTLFYNGPEEFEKHQNISLDISKKNNWYQKKMVYENSITHS